ncbi:MAG TPA: tetratricopeptide repeat protein [candidate division WOR-3 bacterium]|uniref:Tetratricopeptide repeat protein n=1 Tax=candidate division WOR-3 bacterium TaxID=2052148 RepID=A0A7C0ZGT5_UNCW3|nr:tetratricopeptide repeat protein [candidate division WOR-3 bacterium]
MIILLLFSTCVPVKTAFKTPAESLYYRAIQITEPLKAIKIYRDIAVKYPDTPQADSSLFRIAMFYYIQKDYRQAATTFKNIINKGEKSPLYERAGYWAWKCYRILGEKKLAEQIKKGEQTKTTPRGKYTIQMGAFKDMRWAENMYQRLKLLGYDAFIKKSPTLIKVYVGGFSTRDEAKDVLKELKNKGFEGFITRFPR